jgi:hypothetical protein
VTLVKEAQKTVQGARLVVITSVIVALAVSILAFYFISFPYFAVFVLILLVVVTIWTLIHFSGIRTSERREIHTLVVYDGKTGEITDYPGHIVQDIIRQAVQVVGKHDATLIPRITSPTSLVNPSNKKRTVFIDFAELILLRQLSFLLTMLPEEYENHFEELKQLPSGFMENNIIKPLVTTLKDKKEVLVSAINNLDKFNVPKGCKFEVAQNPRYVAPDYRRMVLWNRYVRITVDYQVSGLTFISSMTSGTPVPEIGHLPISPYFFDEAMKKFKEHSLRMSSFYYHVNVELLRPKLHLMLLILGIRPWSETIRCFLSFADYFVDNFDKSFFGSIDIEKFVGPEKQFWEHRFTIETLWQLKHFLEEMEKKSERPLHDYSSQYIR